MAKPHRRYIKEGSLSVEVETKKKNYYFFLFNDLMIATKKKKSLTGSLKSKNPNKNVPSTLRSLNDNTIYSGSKAIIKPGQYIYKFTIPFSMQTKVIPSRDKSNKTFFF